MPRLLPRDTAPDPRTIDRAAPLLVDALLVEGRDPAAARRAYIRQQNALRQQAEHMRHDPPLLVGGRLVRPEWEREPTPPRLRDQGRRR